MTEVSACLSVPTLDEKAWRATEPHTPNPKARLEAVAELNRNGIPTGVLIAPLMPGINDAPRAGGADRRGARRRRTRPTSAGRRCSCAARRARSSSSGCASTGPDLVERYERLYAKGAYLSPAERRKIEVGAGAPWARRDYPADEFRGGGAVRRPRPPRATLPPPKTVVQETLF